MLPPPPSSIFPRMKIAHRVRLNDVCLECDVLLALCDILLRCGWMQCDEDDDDGCLSVAAKQTAAVVCDLQIYICNICTTANI